MFSFLFSLKVVILNQAELCKPIALMRDSCFIQVWSWNGRGNESVTSGSVWQLGYFFLPFTFSIEINSKLPDAVPVTF